MLRVLVLVAALAVVSGSHWDHDIAQIDPPSGKTLTFNPLTGTAAAARTWTPNYPSPYVYENVKATVQPACPMEKQPDQRYLQVTDCQDDEKKDIAVRLEVTYLVLHRSKKQGVKSIGDAPAVVPQPEVEDGKPKDDDGDGIEDDPEDMPDPAAPLGVFIHSVQDGEGKDLIHTLFRNEESWWLHYTFAKTVEAKERYTVVIDYQLQEALEGTEDKNTFRAPWLRQWHAPVKHMDVLWAFPKGFKVNYFEVDPRRQRGENEGGNNGDLPRHTTVCCGEEVGREEHMAKCTRSKEMALYWARGEGECAGKQLVLETRLKMDGEEREEGGEATDDGVEKFGDRYEVRFEPGLVVNARADGVSHSHAWVLYLVAFLVMFPLLAAAIFTFASYGPGHFFAGGRKYEEDIDYGYNSHLHSSA